MNDGSSKLQESYAEGLIEMGNIALGSLMFSQVLNLEIFNFKFALMGLLTWIVLYASAGIISKRNFFK